MKTKKTNDTKTKTSTVKKPKATPNRGDNKEKKASCKLIGETVRAMQAKVALWELKSLITEDESVVRKLATEMFDWIQIDDHIYLGDFIYLNCYCQWRGYKLTYDTIKHLSDKYEWFKDFIQEWKEIEKRKIIEGSSKGKIYWGLGKFILSSEYGMSETTKQIQEVKEQKILNIDVLSASTK